MSTGSCRRWSFGAEWIWSCCQTFSLHLTQLSAQKKKARRNYLWYPYLSWPGNLKANDQVQQVMHFIWNFRLLGHEHRDLAVLKHMAPLYISHVAPVPGWAFPDFDFGLDPPWSLGPTRDALHLELAQKLQMDVSCDSTCKRGTRAFMDWSCFSFSTWTWCLAPSQAADGISRVVQPMLQGNQPNIRTDLAEQTQTAHALVLLSVVRVEESWCWGKREGMKPSFLWISFLDDGS